MSPYYIVLLIAAVGALVLAYLAEKAPNNFSFVDMLRDSEGKPSFLRLAIPLSGASMTVVLLYMAREQPADALPYFIWYGAFWSGAPVAGKAIEAAVNIWGKKT